jgi:uncharacterized membrane protein
MIELSQFIESTLFDIALGVQKAKLRAADLVAIAPNRIDGKEAGETTHVEFDIAVRTSSSQSSASGNSGKIGARARIWVVDASAELGKQSKKNSETGSEHHHRITFKVPIHLNAHFRNAPFIQSDAEIIKRVEQQNYIEG